jgi:hypothetical protein
MGRTTEVFELRLQGIAVPFGEGWQVTATVPHGAFLSRKPDLTLHLRGWHRHGDAAWLHQELFSQNWQGPPTDVRAWSVQDRNLIGGTFPYGEPDKLVREWFISDGRRSANASMLLSIDTPPVDMEAYEQLLESVIFVEA